MRNLGKILAALLVGLGVGGVYGASFGPYVTTFYVLVALLGFMVLFCSSLAPDHDRAGTGPIATGKQPAADDETPAQR